MQPSEPHLSIDYGTACTQAVLVWPDGRWEPLTFDGALTLPSAVHTGTSGRLLVGEAAWRQAATDPEGFVPAPLACLTGPDGGEVSVRGVQVPVADLAAATLRHVAEAAAARVGGPVADARMVVPAGWGPRRRTWLRQVAHRAGLGQPRLLEAPVAAGQRLLTAGVQVPVGSFLLICDLGAGCEATVLRRGPTGFEVLSTLADPHAGAAAIDHRLSEALTNGDSAAGDGRRWASLHNLRAAREALTQQSVVTVPMPSPAPAIVLHARVVDEVAEPVLKQAGELAAQAVTAAELTVEQLTGSYLIGGTAVMPAAPAAIGAQLGATPQAVAQPGYAAVLGSADVDAAPDPAGPGRRPGPAVSPGEAVQGPPWRRLAGIALPGVASLVLYGHMMFTATVHNGTADSPRYGYYVLTVWGELTLAAVFALVAWLAGAALLGAALAQAQQRDGAPTAAPSPARTAGGIALAVTAGLAVAALYAVTAGVYFALPASQPLRWAVVPLLPAAVVGAAIAWTARRPARPPHGWDALLAFPASSVIFGAIGMLLLATWWHGPIPAVLSGAMEPLGRLGAGLVGVGIACALVRHLGLRLVLGSVLAVFGFLIAGAGGDGILAVTYALAVTVWAGYRLCLLLRLPADAAYAR
jgi:hypothetical protein